MSPADQRLAALLREGDPPVRDPAFRLAVLERQARRDLQRRMAMVLGAGAAATALLAAASPSLTTAVTASAPSGTLPAAALALALLSMVWGLKQMRRPI